MADHREALGDHGEDEHGVFLYEPVLHIPWIVRMPKSERAGTVVAEQVRSIDLTPTVLELTGVQTSQTFDGESLAAVMRGTARRDPPASYADAHYPQLHFGWSMLRSLRVAEWKYVDAPKPELYDLRTDRRESRSVLAERGSVAARMSGEIDAAWRSFGAPASTPQAQPDPETLARLRSLGYVGIAAPSSRTGRGADPKGRLDDAWKRVEAAARLEPGSGEVAFSKGRLHERAGRGPEALAEYERAVAINPSDMPTRGRLVGIATNLRRFDVAEPHLRVLLAAKYQPARTHYALGFIAESRGDRTTAAAEYRRALAADPQFRQAAEGLARVIK